MDWTWIVFIWAKRQWNWVWLTPWTLATALSASFLWTSTWECCKKAKCSRLSNPFASLISVTDMIIQLIYSSLVEVKVNYYFLKMIMKERLLSEMGSFVVDSKWEEVLSETINEMFEIRPKNPYLYLQKKMYQDCKIRSLKQKLENNKTSQYLL